MDTHREQYIFNDTQISTYTHIVPQQKTNYIHTGVKWGWVDWGRWYRCDSINVTYKLLGRLVCVKKYIHSHVTSMPKYYSIDSPKRCHIPNYDVKIGLLRKWFVE